MQLASSKQELQNVLGWFCAEFEAARMKISTFKSKAKVLNWKRLVCLLPQVEEFRYHGVLVMSEGKLALS